MVSGIFFVLLSQNSGAMKIFAVGMNYAEHNKELDGTLYKPEEPVIFTKADSALLKDHKPFFIPDWSSRVARASPCASPIATTTP